MLIGQQLDDTLMYKAIEIMWKLLRLQVLSMTMTDTLFWFGADCVNNIT